MTQREFMRRIDGWIRVFAEHPADSKAGLAAVHEIIATADELRLTADEAVELATRIGNVVRGLREVEMSSLTANAGVQ